jgi:hypothetical protein
MIGRSLTRRLERLESALTPNRDERVITITVTRLGKPDETRELRVTPPNGRRRLRP